MIFMMMIRIMLVVKSMKVNIIRTWMMYCVVCIVRRFIIHCRKAVLCSIHFEKALWRSQHFEKVYGVVCILRRQYGLVCTVRSHDCVLGSAGRHYGVVCLFEKAIWSSKHCRKAVRCSMHCRKALWCSMHCEKAPWCSRPF